MFCALYLIHGRKKSKTNKTYYLGERGIDEAKSTVRLLTVFVDTSVNSLNDLNDSCTGIV